MERFINDNVKVENEYFSIYSDSDEIELFQQVLEQLTIKRNEILNFLKIEDFPKTRINFYRNKDNIIKWREQMGSIPYEIGMKAGFFHNNEIYAYLYEKANKNLIPELFAHEFTHVVYQNKIQQNKRITWLDEGLAQYLSGEKNRLNYTKRFKNWYFDSIIRRDKELPKIEYLNEHGSKYGTFCDNETHKYSGYSLSYLIVRYLIEELSNSKFNEIIRDELIMNEIGKDIIEHTVEHYNDYFKPEMISPNFNDIKTPDRLMDYMNLNIIYGWIDNDNIEHKYGMKNLRETYHTMSLEEIINYKIGTCIEQTRLEKAFFDKYGVENKMYCHREYEEDDNFEKEVHMHCFLVYNINNNWFYFEHSNSFNRGIYKFSSLEEVLEARLKEVPNNDRVLTEIPDIPDGLTFKEFNQYVNSFEPVNLEKNKIK